MLETMKVVMEDKNVDGKRRNAAIGHFRYFADFLVLGKFCVVADLTEGSNSVSKVMQTRGVDAHEIVEEVELYEAALDEVEIGEEIGGLWRTKTLIEKRVGFEGGKVFLKPDDEERSGSLSKKSKEVQEAEEAEIPDAQNPQADAENQEEEKSEEIEEEEISPMKSGFGIPLKKRGERKTF